MKKIIGIGFLLILFSYQANAQVGINTNSPVGVFDIDTKGDNSAINQELDDNLDDDLIVTVNRNNEASVVIGGQATSPETAISLELKDKNKALLLNRVSLNNSLDITSVLNPEDGMVVYNTNRSTSEVNADEIVNPGIYVNFAKVWRRLGRSQTSLVEEEANIRELGKTANNSATNGTAGNNPYQQANTLSNIDTGAGATVLSTREPSTIPDVAGNTVITIAETGRYLFLFRWYGNPATRTNSSTLVSDWNYYVYLFKNNDDTPMSRSLVKPWLSNSFNSSTTILTTPVLQAGDKVEIKIGTQSGATIWRLVSNIKTMANRTSLLFFKIQ